MLAGQVELQTTTIAALVRENAGPLAARPVLDDMTVIIPTLGRAILEASLLRIACGSAWPAELIVVDQGPGPRTGAWIERLQAAGLRATLIVSNERGKSASINRGMACAATRFVAITDDDCLAEHDWLQTMTRQLRQHPEAIITGRVDPAGDDEVEFCIVPSRVPVVHHKPTLRARSLIGGNMGVALSVAQRVGPFDEHPSLRAAAEDSDWGYRALRRGVAIRYTPEVVVQHYNWRSTGQRAQRYREYSRSQGSFYGKHMLNGDGLIWLQAIRGLVAGPLRWLRGIMRRDQDMIDRGRAAALELLPGILAGIRNARRT
jgi:GT2 family glycosyltransferase